MAKHSSSFSQSRKISTKHLHKRKKQNEKKKKKWDKGTGNQPKIFVWSSKICMIRTLSNIESFAGVPLSGLRKFNRSLYWTGHY